MDQKYYNISYAESPFGTLNQYMTRTYSWMAAGLLVTFATVSYTHLFVCKVGTWYSGQ